MEKDHKPNYLFEGETEEEFSELKKKYQSGTQTPRQQKALKKKEEKKKILRSNLIYEGKIYEQIYNGTSKYCAYDIQTKEITYHDIINVGDEIIYLPINDDEVTKGYVQLPSEPEEYYSDELLDQEIKSFINKWLDIPEEDVEIGLLTTKKSWVYQRFNTLNYLRVLGDFGTGKSRFLDVFSAIHYKTLKTTGTVTPAALFRVMNKWEGTVSIDEADRKETDETDEVLKIINQGYEADNPVWRCDPNDQTKIEFHNVYGPKILSSRKPFTDKATESRCFTTVLRSTLRKDIPPNINASFKQESLHIRNKLLMWRFRNYFSIDPEAGTKIDLKIKDPRLLQISVGFASMFANDEKRKNRFINSLLEREKELVEERSQSWEGRIFKAIAEYLADGKDGITAGEIVTKADLRDQRTNDLVAPRAITKYMKSLGFKNPKLERDMYGVSRKYYFDISIIQNMAPRYLSDEDLLKKLCNNVTVVTEHKEVSSIDENQQKNLVEGQNDNKGEPTIVSLQPLHRYELFDKIKSLYSGNYSGKAIPIDVIQRKFPDATDEFLKAGCLRGDFAESPSGWLLCMR